MWFLNSLLIGGGLEHDVMLFVGVVLVQAKAQFYLRTHTADESKNEYAAQLQNFNAEQWKHFNNAIPHIFKVKTTYSASALCSEFEV